MSEIDPVILQLRADVNQYVSALQSTTTKVNALLGTQEKKVKQLENQFKRSSGQISGSMKGLAGTLATYFSGRELVGLIDSFTRLQNSLKVAGLEGSNLAAVQQKLFDIGSKYGVSVNALADLYGKSSQIAKELGASQAQLLQITEETSQALLITGTSTEQAQGAILGLSQALASGKVKAEEFNQINEGGLAPLLKAAAASERWGGSIAKLRADIIAGKVSSQELFAAILAGSNMLEKQASTATLTLAGAFQALENELIKYVGSAASGSGATAVLSGAIKGLADNLDILIPALAVLGVALGVGFVANALRARIAAAAVVAAELEMAGGAAIAGVAIGTLGRSLLIAFGGPIGLAVLALAAGIYYLSKRTELSRAATAAYTQAQIAAANINEHAANTANQLANAHGKVRAEALAAAKAERENAIQKLASARASLILAQAELGRLKVFNERDKGSIDSADPRFARFSPGAGGPQAQARAEANIASASETIKSLSGTVAALDSAIKGGTPPKVGNIGAPKKGGNKGAGPSGAGPSGPSAADTALRSEEEIARLGQEELRARLDLTTDVQERADLEKELLFAQRGERVAQIENDKNYTRAQKDAQIAALNRIYGQPGKADKDGNIISEGRPGLAAQRINRDLDRQQIELALAMIDAEQSTLQSQSDIETNTKKRNDIEQRMLGLQQTSETRQLEIAIAEGRVLDAVKARALLEEKQSAEKEKLRVSQLSPGGKYNYDLKASAANINDAIQSIEVQGLQSLNDGLAEAIMGTKSLGDVFKSVARQIISDLLRIAIQRALIQPLSEALFGKSGGGGGGGGLGSILGTVAGLFGGGGGNSKSALLSSFGRASGGYVAPGQTVRVNEAASPGRVEGFMSRDGGQIIPLGRMNAMAGGGRSAPAIVQVHIMEGQMFEPRVQAISGEVSVQVIRSAAPTLIDASARETMARAGRQRM